MYFTQVKYYDIIFFRENFLNLDIYYKYLTVEEIYQQHAFEFLSLISEVSTLVDLYNGKG